MGMDEYKCGDCFHANLCEKSKMLVGFSRDNPAYCGMFLNSADVAPIRHGRWDVDGVYVVCSVCNILTLSPIVKQLPTFKYCPNCGAKMDGE